MTADAPSSPAPSTFWEYREWLKERVASSRGFGSAEQQPAYGAEPSPITPLNERLIQAIWKNQLINTEGLRLVDGRPVRVIDAGRWNGSAGPDFREARIMIDSDTLRGDIEVHIDASQWRAHGHDSDLDYNGVILHVVHRSDDGREHDELHNGSPLPRLELEPYLFPDLETIRRSMTPDDYPYQESTGLGRCYDVMSSLDPGVVADFLDRAGDERLSAKVARLEEQTRHADPEQVFHQALLMSLGSGAAKSLYYLLAKRAPLKDLFDDIGEMPSDQWRRGIEAILFNLAGLIPTDEQWKDAPDEARAYGRELNDLWRRFEPFWSDRRMTPTRRWFRGLRPVNFPTRRLSAVAGLLARAKREGRPLLEDLSGRIRRWSDELEEAKATRRVHPLVGELTGVLQYDDPSSFWTNHYSFTAKPASRSMVLIGKMAARSLVFNAVIPMVTLMARSEGDAALEKAARRLYAIFPTLQPNHITQFTARRLFGEVYTFKDLITTERRQQGLFQVFYACCNAEERNCDECYYLQSE